MTAAVAPIVIRRHQPAWVHEFTEIGAALRDALGDVARRIDHIGSTAVPGLAAKDVIDVQVTVDDLDDPAIDVAFGALGAAPRPAAVDHAPPGLAVDRHELQKRLFRLAPPLRPANIHVRCRDRFNQRYALLCRDYLRSHADVAAAYAEVKRQLADLVGGNADAYHAVKDPALDLFMAGAREWASWTGWAPTESDA